MLLSFSVLGPVEEFQQAATGLVADRACVVDFGSTRDTFGNDHSSHATIEQLEAREYAMAEKSSLAMTRVSAATILKQKQHIAWSAQMASLAKQLDRPANSLMMARTSEYRAMVLDRQRMEALRRQTHPYGGDRAWQLGLRSGGSK